MTLAFFRSLQVEFATQINLTSVGETTAIADHKKQKNTPWKINMEPNQPFRKEHDLPSLHEDMFQPLIFQGVVSLSRSPVRRPGDFFLGFN